MTEAQVVSTFRTIRGFGENVPQDALLLLRAADGKPAEELIGVGEDSAHRVVRALDPAMELQVEEDVGRVHQNPGAKDLPVRPAHRPRPLTSNGGQNGRGVTVIGVQEGPVGAADRVGDLLVQCLQVRPVRDPPGPRLDKAPAPETGVAGRRRWIRLHGTKHF